MPQLPAVVTIVDLPLATTLSSAALMEVVQISPGGAMGSGKIASQIATTVPIAMARPPALPDLDPAVVRLIDALARAQALEDHAREASDVLTEVSGGLSA